MTAAKKKSAPSFAVGDILTLKGQQHVFTVSPPPTGHNEVSGWVWTAISHPAGVTFSLLPAAVLEKLG